MIKETIETLKAYLTYFNETLVASGKWKPFPDLLAYYHELTDQLTMICENQSEPLFSTCRQLLMLDAQLQIPVVISQFDLTI